MHGIEEPGEPIGDVERTFLGTFQDVVVRLALPLDLRRMAVEALRVAIGTVQQQVANGAGDAAIAVVEVVQGDEPLSTTFSVSADRLAWSRKAMPTSNRRPSNSPCAWLTSARGGRQGPPSRSTSSATRWPARYSCDRRLSCGDRRVYSPQRANLALNESL
jgi:hypothetical protein